MAIAQVGNAVATGVGVNIDAGTGSPENIVTGSIGALWIQTDGANGEVLWRKTSGTGTTGWTTYASFLGPASVTGLLTALAGLSLTGTLTIGADVNLYRNAANELKTDDALTAALDISAAGGFRQTIDGWFQENVAASQTDVALTRLATTTEVPTRWIAVRSGSITGMNVKSNAARLAGTLTVKVFKNGVVLGTLTAILDGTNTTFKASTQAKDVDTFIAGDELELRITTDGAWSPTTADIRASLELET